MFYAVIVMFKCLLCIEWWINVHGLNLPREILFERFKGKQVIAENEPVIKDVVVGDPVRCDEGLFSILQQNARLQLRPVLLSNPREFELLFLHHIGVAYEDSCVGTFVVTDAIAAEACC